MKKKAKYIEPELEGKGQATRLGKQHKLAGGPVGIFGKEAKKHDLSLHKISPIILNALMEEYPHLEFRLRSAIPKKEIHAKLVSLNPKLGKTLFVRKSSIKPDGGIIEVKDEQNNWRVVLVAEAKHQGNDVAMIKAGKKQGKNKDQDLMVAGNAIERVHKNILEIRNFMLDEIHFPYVVFLQGSNFATETSFVQNPNGHKIKITYNNGALNRIDRVTASNFGMEINKNHCRNIFVKIGEREHMFQVASLYCQLSPWNAEKMFTIMWDVVVTSLEVLSDSISQPE